MQPNTGVWGVHFPSSSSFSRFLSRSRCAGVRAARHKPSHSPTSAQTRPPSCVGIRQIGFGKRPAGPHFPPALSQATCVRGMSSFEPQDLSGLACCGLPTAIHAPPLQVQYPAARLDAVLPAHNSSANKTLEPRARINRRTIVIGRGRLLAVESSIDGLRNLMRRHRRPATLNSNQGWHARRFLCALKDKCTRPTILKDFLRAKPTAMRRLPASAHSHFSKATYSGKTLKQNAPSICTYHSLSNPGLAASRVRAAFTAPPPAGSRNLCRFINQSRKFGIQLIDLRLP